MSNWQIPTELPDLRRLGIVALDTETRDDRLRADMGSGWPFRSGYLCGVSVAFRDEARVRGLYFPIRHPDTKNFDPAQILCVAARPRRRRRALRHPKWTV